MNSTDQNRVRQFLAQAAVISMICLSITAPALVFSPALPYFTAEQLAIPIVILGYLWLLLVGIARPIRVNGMFLVGLLYFICNIISIAYGATVVGHPLDYRDFYELPKVWLPVAFFTIAYEAELAESSLRRLLTWLSFAAVLVCIYGWCQFFGMGFTYKLNSYYSGGEHIDLALEYARRVYATMGNANVLAELLTWCFVLFVAGAVFGAANRVVLGFAAFASLVTLVMTGSRYGIATVGLGLLWIIASRPLVGRRAVPNIALAVVLAGIAAVTYAWVATSNTRTLQRYQTLSAPLQIDSLRERVDTLWPPAWAEFSRSPVFGHGPGKSFLWATGGVPTYLDSEFLKVLGEQGILGLASFLGYYLYPLFLIRRGQTAIRNAHTAALVRSLPANRAVLHASFIMGGLALAMNIGMATFYMPFLQGFLWMWLGIGARCAMTLRESLAPSNKRTEAYFVSEGEAATL
jgi:hypothetical protein